MSAKSDRIDLNSDAVSVDGDSTQTLISHPLNGDEAGDIEVANCSNACEVDVNLRCEFLAEKAAVNGDYSVEGEVKLGAGGHREEDVTMADSEKVELKPKSKAVHEDAINIENANIDESARHKNSSMDVVLVEGENQAMEIDPGAEVNENQVEFDSGDVNVKSSEPGFGVFDLVWGKVRSHPWWPGQIVDPSAASKKAKKYFRKGSYLIAYFGDHTFAWNDASRIKSFQLYFPQLEKQSNLEEFHDAIDCALEEVSRRVEFGLACPCIPKDVYAKIKTQVVVNAGIQEEASRIHGGDRFSSVASFEPLKPVGFVKALAQQPLISFDRLEFITAQSQLLAFYRWKGYSQLPQLKMLGGLLESDVDIPLLAEVKQGNGVTENVSPTLKNDEQVPSQKGQSKSQGGSSHKRKQILDNSLHPGEKEKSLLELIAKTKKHSSMAIGKEGSDSKDSDKLIPSSSGKKRKSDTITDYSVEKHRKVQLSSEAAVKSSQSQQTFGEDGDKLISSSPAEKRQSDTITDNSVEKNKKVQLSSEAAVKSSQSKQTFGVGNSILKVASQLNGSSSILKDTARNSHKTLSENTSKEKSPSGRAQGKMHFTPQNSSPDDMLSQLYLSARDPKKKYSSLISMVSFFSKFRDSISLGPLNSWDCELPAEQISSGNTQEKPTYLENSEASHVGPMKDSYETDRIIEDAPGEQLLPKNEDEGKEFLPETPGEKGIPNAELQSAVHLSPDADSGQPTVSGNLEAKEIVGQPDENGNEGCSSTALILNFSDLNSVPSETNLNTIFSRYGPLLESQTEVLKKSSRAKVVFKRRADAESAFSSAGKYSIFGPSLVSYRLKYMPSTPIKASPNSKRNRKHATHMEGNAT